MRAACSLRRRAAKQYYICVFCVYMCVCMLLLPAPPHLPLSSGGCSRLRSLKEREDLGAALLALVLVLVFP